MRNHTLLFVLAAALVLSTGATADSTKARCDIYPRGSDHTDVVIPCSFGQRQGNVTITRSDGVTHDLVQVEGQTGHYRDQHGREVLREDGEGSVVILSPGGQQFTLNFLQDYVNAISGQVDARLEGDTWMVTLNGEERYEVPLALIEGG